MKKNMSQEASSSELKQWNYTLTNGPMYDKMSSLDTSMSSSDITEKGAIDFAVKTVSLKAQDSNRILQSAVPLRTLPTPPALSRQGPYCLPTTSTPANVPQKAVSLSRLVTGPIATSSGMSSGTAVTAKPAPPLSASAAVPNSVSNATYLIPRVGVTSSNQINRMTIQPVHSSTPGMMRTQVQGPPNHLRAPSPAGTRPGGPRTMGKPPGPRHEQPRPVVLPNATSRPLTFTGATQLHIPEKGMRLPVGSVTQVLPIRTPFGSVPTFVGANQTTTILQRADGGVTVQASPGTVLTAPVRVAPPLAPLLTTQRVAVSMATVGTRIAVPAQQLTNLTTSHVQRTPVQGVAQRASTPNHPKMSVPTGPPARLAYSAHSTRTSTQVTVTLANSKPATTATVVTSGTRMTLTNQQSRPQTPQGAGASGPPPGVHILHPQLVMSNVRPALVATSGPKVIQHSIPASIHLTTGPKVSAAATSTQTSSNPTSKSIETYKMGSAVSLTRIGGPPTKTYPIGSNQQAPPILSIPEQDHLNHHLPATMYIPARSNPSPGVITSQAQERHTYTLPGGASYYYEAPSGCHLAIDAPLVARPLSPDTPLSTRQLSAEGPLIARPFTPGLIGTSGPTMRYNSVMLVEAGNTVAAVSTAEAATTTSGESKIPSSPRPSILRKRDSEGNINSKVVKNLTAALCGRSRSPSPQPNAETAAQSASTTGAEIGPASNGSSTMSANSSPDPEEALDPDKGLEMSPRKKPRKQLLNDANETIDMEFISDKKQKKEEKRRKESDESSKSSVLKKPAQASLLRSYKHSWKARNNHFQRYTEVRVKEDKRPTVTELANQKQVSQRAGGWKIYHLSTQFENMGEMETSVLDRLSSIFKAMDTNLSKDCEKEVDRVNELIMGNIQRSKVIRDQMSETRLQMMKGFDHKNHVSQILSRCVSKRNFKKREKY